VLHRRSSPACQRGSAISDPWLFRPSGGDGRPRANARPHAARARIAAAHDGRQRPASGICAAAAARKPDVFGRSRPSSISSVSPADGGTDIPQKARADRRSPAEPVHAGGRPADAYAEYERQQQAQNLILKQQLEQNDPKYRQDLEKGGIELENLRNPRIGPADQARLDLERQKFEADRNKPTEVNGRLGRPRRQSCLRLANVCR
ncbi:hypothetical protein, partial [Rhizobium johnstonii]|uniref:hypothetical protein n=1 Tax=Rhizobium johnstonii TaxID=3019933 RepID=UPI002FEFC936